MSSKAKRDPIRSGMKKTYYLLILCVLLAIGSRVYAGYVSSEKEKQGTPVLALNSWISDLKAFYVKQARYPRDLSELEQVVWIPRVMKGNRNSNAEKPSLLTNGKRLFIKDNYLYIYTAHADLQYCSVWAVPLGDKRNEPGIYTNFILLSSKDLEQIWRGPAMEDEQIKNIPTQAIPSEYDMARLGMSKQQKSKGEKKSFWDSIFK